MRRSARIRQVASETGFSVSSVKRALQPESEKKWDIKRAIVRTPHITNIWSMWIDEAVLEMSEVGANRFIISFEEASSASGGGRRHGTRTVVRAELQENRTMELESCQFAPISSS